MSCFCEVAINIGLLFCGMRSAMARGGGISKVYAGLAAYLSVLWWGYPIVWGLAEGANVISSDAEVTLFTSCMHTLYAGVLVHNVLAVLTNLCFGLLLHLLMQVCWLGQIWQEPYCGKNPTVQCTKQHQGLAYYFFCKQWWCSFTYLIFIAGCCICWVGHSCQSLLWLAGDGHIPHCHQTGRA